MDCRPAPEVTETLSRAIHAGDTGYPVGTGYEQAYAAYAADVWGWEFDPRRQAIIVPDVMQGIIAVLDLLGERGAPVVVNPPVYPQFYKYLGWAGREVVEAPLTAEGRIDLATLEAAFTRTDGPQPEAYLLCNPHNPHGTVPTREELAAVAELANRHGVRLVSDEIHAPLVATTTRHVPLLSVPGTEEAVIVSSASKSWNLAGLKAGLAIGGSAVAERLLGMPDQVTHSASHLGVLAHVAALTEARGWLTELMGEVQANKQLLSDLLADQLPEVGFRVEPATYLAWLDCRALGLADPYRSFLQAGVALNNGVDFGTGGVGHVRMNLATSPEIITEAVRRMAAVRG
ncbi:cystathionine beta-lyase [Enemella dayhoffiae]|uniref:cysteine-S-conjugate beta-lyase n=2 Tax=Enemella dayhoffiae TaxID=2016507 RepID=A0A255H302_9ACTN|nr:cystathionine beta-lyase [Enemella dayhoffiae]